MMFILNCISVYCVIAAIRKEAGAWSRPLFDILHNGSGVAYMALYIKSEAC